MQITTAASGSGLLLCEEPAAAADIATLLREHDPNLRLVPQPDEASGSLLWQVWYWNGPDQESSCLFSWIDAEGNPLELGSQIVEKAKLLDRRTASEAPDYRKLNEKQRRRVQAEKEQRFAEIEAEHRPYVDCGRRSVSMGPRPTRQPADHI